MILYHITFHLSNEVYLRGLQYLKSTYIPGAMRTGLLHSPRMIRVLDENADVNGVSLSVQFRCTAYDDLDAWIHTEGISLLQAMRELFGDEIVAFSTLLDEVDLSEPD